MASDLPAGPCRLSVVVASVEGAGALERCLQALVPQVRGGETEVIVAGAFDADQAERYPAVAFLPFPPETPGPVLWGAGLARARGAVLGVTETRTVLDGAWVAHALEACGPGRPIVGGAVEPLVGRSLVSWGAYFADYGPFMRPLERGTAGELPGNNIVFERALLERAPEFTRPAFWKTYWVRVLQDEGVPLSANPALVAYDAKAYRLGPFLRRRFRHGRCFAGMRNARLSPGRRALYAAASPLLPALQLSRVLRRLVPKRRFGWALAASAPVLVLAAVSWALGEAVGYVAGAGDACRQG